MAFFVSSQVLEKIVHLLVLHPQKDGTISLMQEHPFYMSFMELLWQLSLKKRLALSSLKWLEKKRNLEDSDALAYGVGGMEVWNCSTSGMGSFD